MTDSFVLTNPLLRVRPDMLAGMQRDWTRLSQTGTWWSGADRVAIAEQARAASAGLGAPSTSLPPSVSTMARRIATASHEIDRRSVDALADDGVPQEAFVEMVGTIARLTAIDTAVAGVGAEPVPLPNPVEGSPSQALVDGAKRRSAHVPMVGAAGATTALSSVAAEDAAQVDLHGALYLSYAEMGDIEIVKDIPRWQMELAATTTSFINHCVY